MLCCFAVAYRLLSTGTGIPHLMQSSPREITTNQLGVHEDLADIVNKYRYSEFKKPIAEHTKQTFEAVIDWLGNWRGEVHYRCLFVVWERAVLCLLSKTRMPKVIGIDKSAVRLDKHAHLQRQKAPNINSNVRVFQADLNDFWRLIAEHLKTASLDCE